MKLVIAAMSHETNSFSPVPTPLSQFGYGDGPLRGAAARERSRSTRLSIAGLLQAVEADGAEIVVPIVARCTPSAPVEDTAFAEISASIVEAVEQGCDAVLLELHGAMVTQSLDDGEGALLERIRQAAPGIPIGVALDSHANVSERMVKHCTLCAGYKTYPHVDMLETGARVATLLLAALRGEIAPVMALQRAPMLPHTLRMDTNEEPMRSLVAAAHECERSPGILAASVFGGFPLADTPHTGLSCVVVANGDRSAAERAALSLVDQAWRHRASFVYEGEPLAQSVARAKAMAGGPGPVLLVDHADNCNSGGTLDSMAVVEEIIRQGLEDVAVAPVCDPEAVEALVRAGPGATITLDLGDKVPVGPAFRGAPLRLSGKVGAISDGRLVVEGPVMTGNLMNMGQSAVLETGPLQIVVTSRRIEPYDLGVFRSLGIEPTTKRFLLLKSRIQYKPAFCPIASGIVECDGRGVASSRYDLFPFRNLRRPAYPLDSEAAPAE